VRCVFADSTSDIDTVIERPVLYALGIATHIAITGTTGATGAMAGTIGVHGTGIRGGDGDTGRTATAEECELILCS